MNQHILHVSLDVDDTHFHGSAFNKKTAEIIDFCFRPMLKGLFTQLDLNVRFWPNREQDSGDTSVALCSAFGRLATKCLNLIRQRLQDQVSVTTAKWESTP